MTATARSKKHRRKITVDQFLLWAYQNERIDLVCDRGGGLYPEELAASGAVVRRSAGGVYNGVRVDFSNTVCNSAHPDAELVHDLLSSRRLFSTYERGLLFDFAKTGIVPDPMIGAVPRVAPRYDKKGRIVVICGADKKPKVCLLDVQLSARSIDAMRAFYRDWYDAMTRLTGALYDRDDMITSFNIQPMNFLREPWKMAIDVPQKT